MTAICGNLWKEVKIVRPVNSCRRQTRVVRLSHKLASCVWTILKSFKVCMLKRKESPAYFFIEGTLTRRCMFLKIFIKDDKEELKT